MSAFRPIQPSLPEVGDGLERGPIDSTAHLRARRRKAPSHVSLNACTNCKKARAKCDGEEPETCSRCVQRQLVDSCHYEVHIKTAKEELVRKIKALEARNAEKDRWVGDVLQTVQSKANGPVIEQFKQIQGGQILLDVIGRAPSHWVKFGAGALDDHSRQASEPSMSNASEDGISPRWVSVIADEATAHHLMGLYFSWVHPVHMLFSERHFMQSFRSGDSVYCNEAMLNAMCALGCLYSMDGHAGDFDSLSMMETFYRNARRDVELEDRTHATTSIAYAILFILECSKGMGRNGSAHLRLSVESLRFVDRSAWEKDAMEICVWGLHTLNATWASFTYQKPPDPMLPRAIVFNGVESDVDSAYWMFYRNPGDQSMERRSSAPIETAKAFAQLNQIVLETMNVFCGRRGRVTARSILNLYRKYLVWQEALPTILARPSFDEDRAEDPDDVVPHVLFLHCHYFVALVQLFAPLLEEPTLPVLAREHLRRLTLQNAREGLRLLDLYRRRFSGRYQTPLQAFSSVHLGEAVLQHGTSRDADRVILFMLEFLSEARSGFPFVKTLAAMFCESVMKRKHTLPSNYESYLGGRSWRSFTNEEKLDCCDRLSYTQPLWMLLERLDADIADSFEEEWKMFIEVHGGEDGPDGVIERRGGRPHSASGGSDGVMDMSRIMNP